MACTTRSTSALACALAGLLVTSACDDRSGRPSATRPTTAARPEEDPTLEGLAYLQSGDVARAVECFDRAVAADPTDPRMYLRRADALQKLGRTDEALRDFAKAGELD